MFSITLALIFSGVYTTCYGGTHRSDAPWKHQDPYGSSQQYHSYNQNLNKSSNNHNMNIPGARYRSDHRHQPLMSTHSINQHSFRRHIHDIGYNVTPNPNTSKQNIFENGYKAKVAQFQNTITSSASPGLAEVSASLTEKFNSNLSKDPSKQWSIARPPVPPARKVPLGPDCDPSHPGTVPCSTSKTTNQGPSTYEFLPLLPSPYAVLVKPEPDQELRQRPTTGYPPVATLPSSFAMVVQPENVPTDQPTTTKSFAGPTYLPPLNKDTPTIPPTYLPPFPPAKKVPLEPDCDSSEPGTSSCSTSKTTTQEPDQELQQPSTTDRPVATIPSLFAMVVQPENVPTDQPTTTKSFAGPTYLPPLNKDTTKKPPTHFPPSLRAKKVPLEPDCDSSEPGTSSCSTSKTTTQESSTYIPPVATLQCSNTTERPFAGLEYLPATKTYKTLKLDDLKGEPRPWWHVGIYTKTTEPFQQICGGSVVRPDVVISAAHCFWADDIGLLPAEDYAVAGNKVYRPWNDSHDRRVQKSDVSEIKVPPRFRGGKTSFQDDLAVVRLATPFRYASGLRPICVDFDEAFNKQQLKQGNTGVVAGWGYMDEIGTPAQQLLWLELPYVEIEKCIDDADDTFLKYITSDKICAGEASTSRTLCRGDSGGGLAFWAGESGDFMPVLRGVGSAAQAADNKECNAHSVPAFTQIAAHKSFLLEHIPSLDLHCQFLELKF